MPGTAHVGAAMVHKEVAGARTEDVTAHMEVEKVRMKVATVCTEVAESQIAPVQPI